MKKEYQLRKHTFDLVCDKECKILILGSLPSIVSQEKNFYYAHPRNRFWDIMGVLLKESNLKDFSIEEKKSVLLRNHIALYDVISECKIRASSDSEIDLDSIVVCDLEAILKNSKIKVIFLNGQKAFSIFKKYFPQYVSIAQVLPSTSPANAKESLDSLLEKWKIVQNYQ